MLFGHLARMDESADARRILTAVLQSDWKSWQDVRLLIISYHIIWIC